MKFDKTLWKFFLLFFILIFILFNWNRILLFFNYQIIGHNVSEILSSNREESEPSTDNLNNGNGSGIKSEKKQDYLDIPKISLSATIVPQKNNSVREAKNLLKKGTLLYFDSARPGEKGKTIILGHSAPPGWPDINYENVFSKLNDLENGDRILIHYQGREYAYYVFAKKIFFPKEEKKALNVSDSDKSVLVLITCWPPGKNYKRLAVFARLSR